MKTWRVIVEIVRRQPLFLTLIAPLMAVSGLVETTPLIGFAPLIDLLLHPDLSQASAPTRHIVDWMTRFGVPVGLPSVAGLVLALIVLKNLFSAGTRLIVTRLHFRMIRQTMTDVLEKFMGARLQFFIDNGYGILGNTVLRESEKIGLAFESAVNILSNAMRIAAFIGVALWMAWKLTLLALALLGAALLPFFLLGRIIYRLGTVHTKAANEFQGGVVENLGSAKLILAYANQGKALKSMTDHLDPHISSSIDFVMIRAISPLAFEPLGFLVAFAVLFVGARHMAIPISSLFIILYILRTGAGQALNVLHERNQIQHLLPALEQVEKLTSEAVRMAQPTGARPFVKLERGIELRGVRFAYHGQSETLRDVSLEVPRGRMTAFVGKSGSGKTTLVDLILGFYAPDSGQVLIDGVPLPELDVNSWRKRIGFVPQDPFLFHATIRENLLWANDRATDEQIRTALTQANALEFIDELPQGLETVVGDRGVRLSGGQRQRVALARALLLQPDVLILDEATSALDGQSEKLIQEAVERISSEITVIAVAHRLATIRRADRIHFVDHGAVVESGSFDELIRKGGGFLDAARLQGLA